MDFARNDISWFRYEPEFLGNRKLPKEDRMSLEIKRLSLEQVAARYSPGVRGDANGWLREELDKHFPDRRKTNHGYTGRQMELVDCMETLDVPQLKDFQMFCTHTRNYENLTMGGEPLTDPFLFYFELPPTQDPATEKALIVEIREVIAETSNMSAAELGNFARDCVGKDVVTPSKKQSTKKPAGEKDK